MTIHCQLLGLLLLFGHCANAHPPQCGDAGEQCEREVAEGDPQDSVGVGHALLATRVVQTKIFGTQLPLPEATPEQNVQERRVLFDQLRKQVGKQMGTGTADQLQKLFDMTAPALAASDVAPAALLSSTGTQPATGSTSAAAAAARADADYVKDGDDEPVFFSATTPLPPGKAKPNSTLTYDEEDNKAQKHVYATFIVAPLAAIFFFVFTLSNIMEKFEITAIPESGILIAMGVVLGTFMKMYGHFDFFEDPDKFGELNSALLNLILLPIIIFASGWSIRRQDFYSQFPYILMFAMVGVALSTIVIACLIWLTGFMELHGVTSWRTSFAYASLISATDPVATLSTYAKLKVDPLLNIMVFGESIINDAVAIVVFNVFNSDEYMMSSKGESLTGPGLLLSVIWGILKIFCSSTVLGIALGMIYTLIAHWADMRTNKKGQILVIFASCYLTYALAESLGMSGIIAEMFAALLMGIYMRPHLSSEGSLLATFFVKQLAMLADAAVCLLIGVSVVQLTSKGWYFGLWVMLFCLVGRAAAVFPVALVVNYTKTVVGRASGVPEEGWNLLTPQHMFMMWHAGLRGAIALALSLELGKWVDVLDGAGTRRALQTATFFLICTFLLIFGGSTSACLNHLGIPVGVDQPANYLSKTEDMGPMKGFLRYVDDKLLKPVLIGEEHSHDSTEEEKDVEDLLRSDFLKSKSLAQT